ncbi:MAG: ATP-binding cassette domain-containing protein [Clostridia bacterium]|nr:ATP-binding cassette domain-containing protein [Clostridia bacterium]
MKYVLKTEELTKTYSRSNAVDKVSITVKPGEIYGFVGKNGAGKTTFMRTVLGLTRASGGSFSFFDGQALKDAGRRIGSLIEAPALYKNLSAKDNLEMYSIMLKADKSRIPDILKLVGLSDTGKKPAARFSLGMKQRLGIAMALVGDPDFLMLDEPINGLDPMGIVEIRELLIRLRDEGKTIFISSHILGELEKIATCYGIISSGKLIEELTSEQLKKLSVEKTAITASDPEKARDIAVKLLKNDSITIEDGKVYVAGGIPNIGELTNEMFKAGIVVSGISDENDSAEEYFLKKMEEG